MKFDLLPVTTYSWRRKGGRLLVDTPGKNVRIAVSGAFRWPDGPFVFGHGLKSVNTEVFLEMLRALEKRVKRTGRRIVLVLDNDSAHTSGRSGEALSRLAGRVDVFWLPSYTSEQLNEIEPVWKHLKETYFSRMLVERREAFFVAALRLLNNLRRPGALRAASKSGRMGRLRQNLLLAA